MQRFVYVVCLILVVSTSFFLISPSFSGYFNSDTAVQILQSVDFQFDSDWYYWGQARLGSFVPLIGYFIYKLTSIPVVYAVSLALYLTLVALFLVYATFLNKYYSKIALAIIIFLPAIQFRYLITLGHPYGPQLLFIGLLLVALSKLKVEKSATIKSNIWISIAIMSTFLSVWISEYSLVFLVFIFFDFVISSNVNVKNYSPLNWLVVVCSLIAGITFIVYAKYTAQGAAYGNLPIVVDINYAMELIQKYALPTIQKYLLHMILGVIMLIFIFQYFKKIYLYSKPFIVLTILSLFPAIILNWVVLNGFPSRFFTPFYFFAWMAVLFYYENVKSKRYVTWFVFLIIVLQSLPILKFEWNTSSEMSRLKKFSQLGNVALIGDYWSSYNISAANINTIIATPNELTCRNFNHAEKVMQQQNIYLIANNWLENFPDSIMVFDKMVYKTNDTILSIDEYRLSKYKTK